MRARPPRLARTGLAALALVLALPAAVVAADLERALDEHWRGGFVVVLVPLASGCSNFYTDDDVRGQRVDSRGDHRFAAGELARVDHVAVKWGGRVDVFLDLAEPILDRRSEGPFTLYDEHRCKVQLKVDGAAKGGLPAAEAALAALLELHSTRDSAIASTAWNRRHREALPPDYDRTLAAYEEWQASQQAGTLDKRMREAIEEASQINQRVHNEPDYLSGLADGMQRTRDHVFGSCDSLADAALFPDSTHGSSSYRDGYTDGQRLGFDLALLDQLARCSSQTAPRR